MALNKTIIRVLLRQNRFVNIVPATVSNQKHRRHDGNKNNFNEWKSLYPAISASALIGVVLAESAKDDNSSKNTSFEAGEKRPDLPIFKAEEVSKHNNKNSFWVTYRHGVYDVTSFLPSHPGGEQIYNAAGYSIEPFWNVYGMHKTEEVYRLLESYRIGNLHEDDIVDHSDDELWAREPARRRELLVKTAKPFNAEVPPSIQVDHFDTPNDLFYVRQHMPVPDIDASRHKVKVTVKSSSKVTVKEFTLDDLKRFEPVTIRAALMCAGNRRSEMNKVKPVKGLSWGGGAISNAVWTGYRLRDVLYACGINGDDLEGQHVVFTGADIDATGTNFSTSIPLHMALNPNLEILLAYEMNGHPLPPDHGYPMRVVVPGAPAVRSVKWLESITVSENESASHWHQKDYRSFNPSKDWDTADFPSAPPVYSLPVTSAICDPLDGDTVKVKDGHVVVRGYAYSGGGAKVLRVDLSADQGATWIETDISASDAAPPGRHYSWLLWTARVPVTKNMKEVELWVKATDSNFNTQPENFRDIWNIRGILSNAYHKIKVQLTHHR